MGWRDPVDTYETIPDSTQGTGKKKMSDTGSFNRERVRYVKDPLGETKYAYHINYHGGDEAGQGSSNGVIPQGTPSHQQQHEQQQHQQQQQQHTPQQHQQQNWPQASLNKQQQQQQPQQQWQQGSPSKQQPQQQQPQQPQHPSLLKQHSLHKQQQQLQQHQQQLQQQQQQHQQQQQPVQQTMQRGMSREGKRVGFAGNEVLVLPTPTQPVPPAQNPHYMNDPLTTAPPTGTLQNHTNNYPTNEGFDPTPYPAQEGYEPTPYHITDGAGQSLEKDPGGESDKKGCKSCSMPPWWGWVIIILITCLLAAVLYFIFARVITPEAVDTQSDVMGPPAGMSVTKTPPLTGMRPTNASSKHLTDLLRHFSLEQGTRSTTSQLSSRMLPSVNTTSGCLQACLNQSETCYGVDFDEQGRRCHVITRLQYELEPLGNSPQVTNYRRIFSVTSDDLCHLALTYNYRHTLRSGVRHRQAPGSIKSLRDCRNECLGLFGNGVLEGGYWCSAAVYDVDSQTCLLTDVKYGPETLMSSDTTTHIINNGVQCVKGNKAACHIKFSTSRDQRPADLDPALEQPGVTSVPVCASRCLSYLSPGGNRTCTAFVFKYEVEPHCTLYTGKSSTALQAADDVDFYRRQSDDCSPCDFTKSRTSGSSTNTACQGCDPSEFIATVNTSPTGGTHHGRPGVKECSRVCQEGGGSGGQTCYGFTVNTLTNNCTLFFNINYQLDGVGESLESIHYRRVFACSDPPSLCNQYEVQSDRAGVSPGVTQPWDINTPARCTDRCWGYLSSTNLTCTGVDFNRLTARCKVYLSTTRTILEEAPGVDHYTRRAC